MSTWYDVKLATLQKMFAADNSIVNDESTSGYIAAMPYAANEALQMLSTAGKFLIKKFNIVHAPVDNILPDTLSKTIHQIINGSKSFDGSEALSYYFEVCGIGTCTITVGDTSVKTINLTDKTQYTIFRGNVTNADKKLVTLTFSSTYPMEVRNIALYAASFPSDDDVPTFREKIPYKITDIVDDFYMLDPQGIYFEGDYSTYLNTSDFYQEADKTILLNRKSEGSYTVYYKAYPPQITAETEDTYELPLDAEIVPLMPLYMASQLYKDDDNGIATSYRNEFEVAFERLKNGANRATKEAFTSESGWI